MTTSKNLRHVKQNLQDFMRFFILSKKQVFRNSLMTLFAKSEINLQLQMKDKLLSKYQILPDEKQIDSLIQQQIRERKGSFPTPKVWVEKSHEYLKKAFGKNWQDEYIIWDCCCGEGNLLAGLTNPNNVWASTIDQADIDVLDKLIDCELHLLKNQIFQFDFLNDDFTPKSKGGKIPDKLFKIINNPDKQKKLIVYINPPYAEAASHGARTNKSQVAAAYKSSNTYKGLIGLAVNEVFAQFFMRIWDLLPNTNLAAFSTLKYVNSANFVKFRSLFKAKYCTGFICRANTFDNVRGEFPIGFLVWQLSEKKVIKNIKTDILLTDSARKTTRKAGTKSFYAVQKGNFIIDWFRQFFDKKSKNIIGYLRIQGTDMQQNRTIFVTSQPSESDIRESKIAKITANNLIESSIYVTVRHIFESNWINNRDQFLYPNNKYKINEKFQNNCLTYMLFDGQNKIQSKIAINHFIPFRAKEVRAKVNFKSNLMYNFLQTRGKFSKEAIAVFESGKKLWTYYHEAIKSDNNADVNASLYDIRVYFKKRNPETGRLNMKSIDQKFNELDQALKDSLKNLAEVIKPKVYEYGFLLE
jgi:hypothetical protein